MDNVNDTGVTTQNTGVGIGGDVGTGGGEFVGRDDRQININFSAPTNASTDEWRQWTAMQLIDLSRRITLIEDERRAETRPLTFYEKAMLTGFAMLTIAMVVLSYVVIHYSSK